jgi:uncharacterized OB-fold protein
VSEAAHSEPALPFAAFWQAARAGRLDVQRCSNCSQLRYFPAPLCPRCLSLDHVWQPVSGEGTLYAFTTVHRAPTAAMAKEVPYTIAFVELAEGPRVMARLEGIPPAGVKIGEPVTFAGVGDSGAGPWLRFRCNATDR